VKTLRLAVPLLLAAFTLTCQSDQTPVSPGILSPVFASCGDPPCGRGPGGGRDEDGTFALSFDGNDGTETPDSDALDLTNTFTIEGWIKPTQPAGSEPQSIISKWGLSVSASYGVAFEQNGRFLLVTHDPGATPDNSKIYANPGAVTAGVWQHFAFVVHNGRAWLYLDGEIHSSCGGSMGNCWNQNEVRNVPNLNTPQVTTSRVSVGRQNSPEGFIDHEYIGLLDEVRMWNVARTAKQIRQNMNKTLNLRKASGLVAYWRMNEGSGQVAADGTGNGHDQQLGNTGGNDAADPAWVSPGKP